MRTALWTLGALAIASAGLFACSSDTVTAGSLGFSVAESLLVLYPEDATVGYVLLSSGTGTCPALQSGLTLVPAYAEVAGLDYVYVPIGVVAADDSGLPLSAGTYNIVDPTDPVLNPPGLFAYMAVAETDNACDPIESDANSGTVTISPFSAADGGTSSLNYATVFGSTSLSGVNALTTCLVSINTPIADAGTCVACVPAADGGACAIQ